MAKTTRTKLVWNGFDLLNDSRPPDGLYEGKVFPDWQVFKAGSKLFWLKTPAGHEPWMSPVTPLKWNDTFKWKFKGELE